MQVDNDQFEAEGISTGHTKVDFFKAQGLYGLLEDPQRGVFHLYTYGSLISGHRDNNR